MKRPRLIGIMMGTALAVGLISCTADSGTGPMPEFAGGTTRKLARCAVLGSAFSGRTIGPAGGTITAGKHSLVIPAGALRTTVFISMTMNPDTTANVKLQPEGLQFAPGKPAKLTLDYKHCSLTNPVQIAYTTDQFQIIRLLPSVDDKRRKKVSTSLEHFSRYAVAY